MALFKDLLEVCDKHMANTLIDINLVRDLKSFRLAWAQKSTEYIEFLGSSLVGVHNVRFSFIDEENLYQNVLHIDRDNLDYDVKRTKGINPAYKVSSNPTFIILTYLMHRLLTSNLNKKDIEDGVRECYYIFAYKVIGSLYSNYFKYPVDEGIAKVVYERMNNKYLLKGHSWQEVFNYRATDLLPPHGLHYARLLKYDTYEIVRVINDLQGRLREIVKNAYIILAKVTEDNEKIGSSSQLTTIGEDGEIAFRETLNDVAQMVNYTRSLLSKPNDFVKDSLVELLLDDRLFPKLKKDILLGTLRFISLKVDMHTKDKLDVIEYIIITTITYLRRRGITANYKDKVYEILIHMKNYWSTTTVTNKAIADVKDYLSEVVTASSGLRTNYVVATYVLAIILYIFLRGVSKNV